MFLNKWMKSFQSTFFWCWLGFPFYPGCFCSPHHAGTSAAILPPWGSEKQPAHPTLRDGSRWKPSRSERWKESKLSLLPWSSKMHYPPSRATYIYESLIVTKCISLHAWALVRQGFQLPADKVMLCLCLVTWHRYIFSVETEGPHMKIA